MDTKSKFIFLDFDGVLHSESDIEKPHFFHMLTLCQLLMKYRHSVKVVISSSWRMDNTLEQLKSHFPTVVRDLIVGVTPIINDSFNNGGRQKEIELYCHEHNIAPHEYIALDDLEYLFEKKWPNLILVNGHFGLTSNEMKLIEKFLIS